MVYKWPKLIVVLLTNSLAALHVDKIESELQHV